MCCCHEEHFCITMYNALKVQAAGVSVGVGNGLYNLPRQHSYTNNTTSKTHKDNFASPVSLMRVCLDCGRKSEHLEPILIANSLFASQH